MRLLHCHREASGRMWLTQRSGSWCCIQNFPFPLLYPLSYIGCCRAVLTEVYEGLMLPLPPELYCSPATNPTLDSSDSDETPLRSLQEPPAPKMVTANAKRYRFCSIPWRKTLSCINSRRNQIISSSLVRHTSFQAQKQIAVKKQKTSVCSMCNSLVPHKGLGTRLHVDHLSFLVQL